MVNVNGQPHQTLVIAAKPPSKPINEPTDKSISAEMITKIIPIAKIPVIEVCRSKLEILRALR